MPRTLPDEAAFCRARRYRELDQQSRRSAPGFKWNLPICAFEAYDAEQESL